jgi:hypothetical protein
MLENPKIIDAYVKILNKKHPSFFHDPFIIETKKNKSEITDEQKLRENDNLKSKKRKALQEEFKKNEFKNIHNPISRGSIITTTSTLEGDHHFYIQDDAKFNSLDGASGPWTPGQVRTFRIPTNQMLECRSISILSVGFNVKQGIGAS